MAKCLVTERLVLRPFRKTDLPAVHAYASDPEVVRYLNWGVSTKEETLDFIQRTIEHGKATPRLVYEFAVTLRNPARLIGGCKLEVVHPDSLEAEIGYVLAKEHWGKGYGTEAVCALTTYGLNELHMHRLIALCDPANLASQRVLEKAGFLYEGLLREYRWFRDRWWDFRLYAIVGPPWSGNGKKL
jgi:[ribosomal protein S5]-alanine N-acetyltransferase